MWEGDRNDLALDAARTYPERLAVMGRLDPEDPASRGRLAGWRAQPGMLGVRLSFAAPLLQPLLTEGRMDWVWDEAERAGVPLYVLVKPVNLPLIDAVAAQHPGLKLTMDHLALPLDKKDEEAFRSLDHLLALATHPNVAVKVSSLPNFSSEPYPHRNLHPHLRRVYDAFGPKRMFWGSDLTRLNGTYRQCVTLFTEELPWLSQDDLAWIMGQGVCAWLDWR
jgi:predicted TIM-barrel fold metal-dependent hydrolase